MSGEGDISERARFDRVRYAQCWEDADVLLEALAIEPGDVCLSIASAGDNTFALLLADPSLVVAVDLSTPQLACLDLRQAAYRTLDHESFLALYGATDASPKRRGTLFDRCRASMRDAEHRRFWDFNREALETLGFGAVGKFENYFKIFRERLLPLVHARATIEALFAPKERDDREAFYNERWNTWRWRQLFGVFFSKPVLGALGRDPAFFDHVEGGPVAHLTRRTRHALVELEPAKNPYLSWILRGTFDEAALPLALRRQNFETIAARVDRVRWRQGALEDVAGALASEGLAPARFNLSDIFEYMSEEAAGALLERLADHGTPGGRLAYWNMIAPRARPERLAARLIPRSSDAQRLHARDKAFFYSAFVIEEIAS